MICESRMSSRVMQLDGYIAIVCYQRFTNGDASETTLRRTTGCWSWLRWSWMESRKWIGEHRCVFKRQTGRPGVISVVVVDTHSEAGVLRNVWVQPSTNSILWRCQLFVVLFFLVICTIMFFDWSLAWRYFCNTKKHWWVSHCTMTSLPTITLRDNASYTGTVSFSCLDFPHQQLKSMHVTNVETRFVSYRRPYT